MKTILLFLICASICFAAFAEEIKFVAPGSLWDICYASTSKVKCVNLEGDVPDDMPPMPGESSGRSLKIPQGTKFSNIKSLAVGSTHLCVLDDLGVRCFGQDYYGSTSVPKDLGKVSKIHASDSNTCAITQKGVRCWGSNDDIKHVPALTNPRDISVSRLFACAIDDNGVKCWGDPDSKKYFLPSVKLQNPHMVTAGEYHACAIDDTGMKCWGGLGGIYNAQKIPLLQNGTPVAFQNPRWVGAGNDVTCIADEKYGFGCWGNNAVPPTSSRTETLNAFSLNATEVCVIDEVNTVLCWGSRKFKVKGI